MKVSAILVTGCVGSLLAFMPACGDDDDDVPPSPPAECTRNAECELTTGRFTNHGIAADDAEVVAVEVRAGACVEGKCFRVIEVDGECFVNSDDTKYDCALSDERILEMAVASSEAGGSTGGH
jgi:hypothetical protein